MKYTYGFTVPCVSISKFVERYGRNFEVITHRYWLNSVNDYQKLRLAVFLDAVCSSECCSWEYTYRVIAWMWNWAQENRSILACSDIFFMEDTVETVKICTPVEKLVNVKLLSPGVSNFPWLPILDADLKLNKTMWIYWVTKNNR